MIPLHSFGYELVTIFQYLFFVLMLPCHFLGTHLTDRYASFFHPNPDCAFVCFLLNYAPVFTNILSSLENTQIVTVRCWAF